ncbi:MAG: type II/IV secretion system ATPase subunit [Desulfurococcales archaeon]|nr:type II/IV secretion system ATPase subunit [Desulfurococcales archaeon]
MLKRIKGILRRGKGEDKGARISREPVEAEDRRPRVLPPEEELRINYKIVKTYPVNDPWSRVMILEDRKTGELLYYVDEIKMTEDEKRAYEAIQNILMWEMEPPPENVDIVKYFERQAKKAISRYRVRFGDTIHPGISWGKIEYYILRDNLGYGPLDPIMRDPYVEDISCDGIGKPIYVWHQEYESMPTNIRFTDEKELDSMILKLAHKAGKHVSIAFPIVDAILPEGHRLAATYRREVTTSGSTFTIRKFKDRPLSVIDLVRTGTISPRLASYFWILMEHNKTGMIMGVTGSGKTTMLNALATLLRPTLKVVTIEDTPELKLTLENWVQLVSRPSYGFEAGVSEVSLYDLVKVSLRYRPDVLIVGEVRGEEAKVLFQAIATGHGGLSTIHAEDVDAMVKRLTSPPMEIPQGYIPLLNFALAIKRIRLANPDGTFRVVRRVTNVWEIEDYGSYRLISFWNPSTRKHEIELDRSMLLARIAEEEGKTLDEILEEAERREEVIKWMAVTGTTDYREVSKVIHEYYVRPSKVYNKSKRELRKYEAYK